jgi:plasmid maintenance system antidote protein VapI
MEVYIQILKKKLLARQQKNPHYSLRAFARDIGLHPSSLSAVLKEKRNLPIDFCEQIVEKLDLSKKQKIEFIESVYKQKKWNFPATQLKKSIDKKTLEGHLYYKIIAEWEHFAVLTLLEIPMWISAKLRKARICISSVRDVYGPCLF